MALRFIGAGAALADGDPRQLIVFVSGYLRPDRPGFHFADYAHGFAQTRLLLRDPSNALFSRGIPGVTASPAESLAFLRALIARLRPQRVTFVAGSVATHPTVLWACELGATDVHLICPVTDAAALLATPRANLGAFRAMRDMAAARLARGEPHADLRPYLCARGHRVEAIDLYYGLDDPVDTAQARHIADLPNVRSTVYHRGDHMRVPMFVQRRDHELADRINLPVVPPAALRAAGACAARDLGHAAVRLDAPG